MTMNCARCHDHKIDPIPQRDYYKLLAFFHNINHFKNGGPTDEAPVIDAGGREAFEQRIAELAQQRKQVQGQIEETELNFKQLLEGQPGREPVLLADLPDLLPRRGAGPGARGQDYIKLKRDFAACFKGCQDALAVSEAGPRPRNVRPDPRRFAPPGG
jgi:hypothetical protein